MPTSHRRGKRPPTEYRVRARRYARLFNRGFAAILICVLIGLYALLVLGQDLFGPSPRHQYVRREAQRELTHRIFEAVVESGLRRARELMSETMIRAFLAVIIIVAFGSAVAIGWLVWYQKPLREKDVKSGVTQ